MNTLIETENALSTVEENPTQKTAMQTRYPISHLTRKTKLLGFSGDLEREITGVEYDSRRIQPGNVFVAVSGLSQDGSKFIEEAVARGATAIVSEHPASNFETREDHPTFIHVADARAALAQFSNEFYASPSDRLKLTGITGSNGKTTTSYYWNPFSMRQTKKRVFLEPSIIVTVGKYSRPHSQLPSLLT